MVFAIAVLEGIGEKSPAFSGSGLIQNGQADDV
jgi:hypothetical protein